MPNHPIVGRIRTELGKHGDPVLITAVAEKWDVLDIVVVLGRSAILGKTDISKYVVAEYDTSGSSGTTAQNSTYYVDQEEALRDWLSRAFGVTL